MKLNFFCIVLIAVAAIVSCNSRVEDNEPNDFIESTGKPTYIALDLSKDIINSYAGETSVKGFVDEKNIGNAAIFVYKWDGANMEPESYSFLSTLTYPVVMKITDGTKKVFVALNIGATGATLFDSIPPAIPTTPVDEGGIWGVHFNDLNRTLWAAGNGSTAPGCSLIAPAPGSEEGTSAGLIKTLAGGSTTLSEGRLALITSGSSANITPRANAFYVMSNWDGPDDNVANNSADYPSTCIFTFDPDISKTDAPTHPQNSVKINVQLAVAKATLKFDPANLYSDGYSYLSEGDGGDKGYFTPWNAMTGVPGIFTAGNINKAATVFQKFSNGSVADDNYQFIDSNPGSLGGNDDWYRNSDNTRVFGTGKRYLTSGNTVANIYNAMTGNQAGEPNSVRLGMDTLYLTENAQAYPAGFIDNSTYLFVGGKYNPRRWISDLQQAADPTNSPIIACNGVTIPPGTPSGAIFPGTDYAPVIYSLSPLSNDTLYFSFSFNTFFHGKNNIYKYYAWVEKRDTDTPYNPGAGLYGAGTSPTPETSAAVIDAVNSDIASGNLVAYYQGICFYRIFIVDYTANRNDERVLVRRNHTYDVIISNIAGPGNNDWSFQRMHYVCCNNETESYGAFTISIDDQHKITQTVTVSYNIM